MITKEEQMREFESWWKRAEIAADRDISIICSRLSNSVIASWETDLVSGACKIIDVSFEDFPSRAVIAQHKQS